MVNKNDIKNIDLMITEQCNMNCTYCFSPRRDSVLTIEQGKKVLDRMKDISPDALNITFFGGEPLLYPKTVLELAQYSRNHLWKDKDKKHTCTFHVVTNGTYFDEEMFKLYKSLGFSIQVSMDGDKITTEEHRGVQNFDLIVNNVKQMLKIFPNLGCRMTYTPKTVGRLSINVQFLHELGINKIMHQATIEDNWCEDDIAQYSYQLHNLYHYRRHVHKQGKKLNILFIDKTLKIINDEVSPELDFCQAGKSYISILPNGDVHPCHRAASNRIFKLGNIFNEKRPFIRGVFLNLDKEYVGCSQHCGCYRTCHSCLITHYLVNKDLTKPCKKYCKIPKLEYELARSFLPAELADRRERKLNKMANVIADIAEQNEELISLLKEKKQ